MKPSTARIPFLFSSRMLITSMCFWAICNLMFMRLNISVAIVCMVNHTATQRLTHEDRSTTATNNSSSEYRLRQVDGEILQLNSSWNGSRLRAGGNTSELDNYRNGSRSTLLNTRQEDNSGESCQTKSHGAGNDEAKDGPLLWSKEVQGQVLGSYFYGYVATMIPTGWLLQHVSSKNIVLFSSLAAAVTCFTIPLVAVHSVVGVIFLRVITGLLGGMLCPSTQNMLSHWSPPEERTTMSALTFSGFAVGILGSFVFSGLLCRYGFSGGWPSVFYVFGIQGLAFCVCWFILVSDRPSLHKRIEQKEREYIEGRLQGIVTEHSKRKVPWKSLCTSKPVLGTIMLSISLEFVATTFFFYLPTYFFEVMNFSVTMNGALSSLPYAFCFLAEYLSGHLSDVAIRRCRFTVETVRKFVAGLGQVLCICTLVAISFVDCDQPWLAVFLVVINISSTGFMMTPLYANPMDIAPQYAGLIVAIFTTVSNCCGFISPIIVAAIINKESSRDTWQMVFFISAGVVAVGLMSYMYLASGQLQDWAVTTADCSDMKLMITDSHTNTSETQTPRCNSDKKTPTLKEQAEILSLENAMSQEQSDLFDRDETTPLENGVRLRGDNITSTKDTTSINQSV